MADSIEKIALRLVCINVTGSVAGALAPRCGAHLITFGAQCSEDRAPSVLGARRYGPPAQTEGNSMGPSGPTAPQYSVGTEHRV